jgi:hemerythrin-like domain-containing protein
VRQISTHLDRHTHLEEDVFYPAIRRLHTAKVENMVLEAYEEHHVVKTMARELCEADPRDERFSAKLTVLKELVAHHVEEEEQEMFKLAKKLGRDELEALGEELAVQADDGDEEGARASVRAAKTRRRVA